MQKNHVVTWPVLNYIRILLLMTFLKLHVNTGSKESKDTNKQK